MSIRSDRAYIDWVLTTTDDEEIIDKINNFDGKWPRQFLFRLLYKNEDKFSRYALNNIKFYLDL